MSPEASRWVSCLSCWKLKEPPSRRALCDGCGKERQLERGRRKAQQRAADGKQAMSSARWYQSPKGQRWRHKGMPRPLRPLPKLCELCGKPETRKVKGKQTALALDHCHTTGIFRGWLCFKCNSALGKLGDCLAGLRRAVAYLEKAYGETK